MNPIFIVVGTPIKQASLSSKPKLYTGDDIYTLLFGLDDQNPECLKKLVLRCKEMPDMHQAKYMPGVFLNQRLEEDFIIRSPYSKGSPINIYNLNGNKVAYIGDYSGANWGDSITLPRNTLMNSYTDLADECPLLIMRLANQNGEETIHLTHVRSQHIDSEVANLIHNLRDNKRLSPKEIIFSPRSDSRYGCAFHDLKSFGENIEVEVIGRKNNHHTQALVTPEGWCIYDSGPQIGSKIKSLIAARLWKED